MTCGNCTQRIAATLWFWIFSAGFLLSISISLYILLATKILRWILLFYLAWIWYDRNASSRGGRRIEWFRQSKWFKLMRQHFQHQIVPETDDFPRLDSSKNYMLACYPHGIFPVGPFAMCVSSENETIFGRHKVHFTALGLQFWMPIIREMFLAVGAIAVTAASITNVLLKANGGNAVSIVVGGGEEAVYSSPGMYKIILKKRKGFIKLALKMGSPIVPVFTFGETDIFEQLNFPGWSLIRNIFHRITQVGLVLPKGLVPNAVPVTTVVGVPIPIKKIEAPTDADINKIHAQFVDSIKRIFETHKVKYVKNYKNVKLEIV